VDIKSCYDALGVSENATMTEIKEAYRSHAKAWHPDRFANDPKMYAQAVDQLKKINGCYDALKNHMEGKGSEERETANRESERRESERRESEKRKAANKEAERLERVRRDAAEQETKRRHRENTSRTHSPPSTSMEKWSGYSIMAFLVFGLFYNGLKTMFSGSEYMPAPSPPQQAKPEAPKSSNELQSIRFQSLLEQAKKGDAPAQNNLGRMYAQGKGVPQDYIAAVKWFSKSAEQGIVEAQCSLGWSYYQGHGVPMDYAEAMKWSRMSAERGYPNAQHTLGDMYEKGRGVAQNLEEAYKWYNLAAARSTDNDQRNEYIKLRDSLAVKMTPAQIAEAQKRAREWKPKQ